jgi:hypothetical protein
VPIPYSCQANCRKWLEGVGQDEGTTGRGGSPQLLNFLRGE